MTQIPVKVEFIRNPVTRTDVKITPVYWGKDEDDALAFQTALSESLLGYFDAMWGLARHDPKEIVVPSWIGWTSQRDMGNTGPLPLDLKVETDLIADGASHRIIRVYFGPTMADNTLLALGRDGSIGCSGGWRPVIRDGKITDFRKGAGVTPNQLKQLQDALRDLVDDPAWKHKIVVLPGEFDE